MLYMHPVSTLIVVHVFHNFSSLRLLNHHLKTEQAWPGNRHPSKHDLGIDTSIRPTFGQNLAAIKTRSDPRGSSPPWGLPRPRAQKPQKSSKSSKKKCPGKRLDPCLKVVFDGPSSEPPPKKPNGICVWSRCICHSVKILETPHTQAHKPWQLGSSHST